MAARDQLRADLQKRLNLSSRQLDRRIAQRENDRLLPRRLAMLSLARDANMALRKYASENELGALRGQDRLDTDPPAVVAPAPPRTTRRIESAGKATSARRRALPAKPKPAGARDKVFVVHGRDTAIRNAMFSFLRSVRLDPMEWGKALNATGKAQPSIPETVDAAFREVSAVVVLLTPDDLVVLKPRLQKAGDLEYEKRPTGQARPNVLFEAGLAFGRHPEATVLVMVGAVKPFTDVSGLHITRLDNTPESRSEFVDKLRRAGCDVDTDGRADWYSEGNFEIKESDDGDN